MKQFSASGQLKYNALGNSTLYSAAGIKLDWLKNLSKKLNIKLELEIEQQSYQPQHYSYQSGTQLAITIPFGISLMNNGYFISCM